MLIYFYDESSLLITFIYYYIKASKRLANKQQLSSVVDFWLESRHFEAFFPTLQKMEKSLSRTNIKLFRCSSSRTQINSFSVALVELISKIIWCEKLTFMFIWKLSLQTKNWFKIKSTNVIIAPCQTWGALWCLIYLPLVKITLNSPCIQPSRFQSYRLPFELSCNVCLMSYSQSTAHWPSDFERKIFPMLDSHS